MSIPTDEQETVIRKGRTDKTCIIYTSDTTEMTRLDKLYRCVSVDKMDGIVVAKTYEAPKKCVSYRTDAEYKPDYTPKRPAPEHFKKKVAGE